MGRPRVSVVVGRMGRVQEMWSEGRGKMEDTGVGRNANGRQMLVCLFWNDEITQQLLLPFVRSVTNS